jgi:hypothetical protein
MLEATINPCARADALDAPSEASEDYVMVELVAEVGAGRLRQSRAHA